MQGGGNVVLIPNGTVVPDVVNRAACRNIIFVGLLSYEPNRMGIEWFISEIWPKIFEKFPDARFDAVGMSPSEKIKRANGRHGIHIHGFVDNLEMLYSRASVSVVPLKAGAGTRLKIFESIGRAVPVVSTTIGAFGIPLNASHGVMRADTEDAIASICMDIIGNPAHVAHAAARAGRRVVMDQYDWRKIRNLASNLAGTFREK